MAKKNKARVQVFYNEAHLATHTVWDYIIGIPFFVVEIIFFTWLFSGGKP